MSVTKNISTELDSGGYIEVAIGPGAALASAHLRTAYAVIASTGGSPDAGLFGHPIEVGQSYGPTLEDGESLFLKGPGSRIALTADNYPA